MLYVWKKTGVLDSPNIPTNTEISENDAISKGYPKMATSYRFLNYDKYQAQQKKKKKQKNKLEAEVNRFKPNSLAFKGCALLQTFARFLLKEQQRSDDPVHANIVKKLSKGQSIDLEDIMKYQNLTEEDILKYPQDWKYAPTLVATNLERVNITRMKAQMFAKENSTYVLKWKCKLGKQQNTPPNQQMEQCMRKNAFFYQYWVPGAQCNLSYNVNGELALVNGAPMVTHSLSFSNQEAFNHILDVIEGENPPEFGSEIEIDPPLAVNMVVSQSLDNKPVSRKRQKQLEQLKKFSILPNQDDEIDVVISITESMATGAKNKFHKFAYQTQNILHPVATAEVCDIFPFDLAFSMTIHKAQGRTIERVVLDLTSHPYNVCQLEFASIFVAMSRVKKMDHIRLITHQQQGVEFDPQEAYSYITELKPSKDVMAFYHGYENQGDSTDGICWNPALALNYTKH